MKRHAASAFASLLLAAAASVPGAVAAQERTVEPYQPLFTDRMIESAAPEQRERMRAAEEYNRSTYQRRQLQDKDPADAVPATPAASAPPPPRRPSRSKIYRWVDDKGRVHFGDAPAGKGAEEVHIKGAAGGPPRAAPGGAASPPDRPAAPARSNIRQERRGS